MAKPTEMAPDFEATNLSSSIYNTNFRPPSTVPFLLPSGLCAGLESILYILLFLHTPWKNKKVKAMHHHHHHQCTIEKTKTKPEGKKKGNLPMFTESLRIQIMKL